MITKEQLFAATDKGMMILELHYRGVREAAMKKQPFKMRADERTPSAHVKLIKQKDGLEYWAVTDFGDDSRAKNPVQVHMDETGLDFSHAMLDLMTRFNLSDDGRSFTTCKPDIRKKPAQPDQEDGKTDWDIDQDFTEKECKVMGPKVTPEVLKKLHWYRANHIVSVKAREAVYKYSNENYPIFIRECWFYDQDGNKDRFYKIYEPLNMEKKWRFQYQPAGKKPQSYINGLFELRQAFEAYNETAEKEFRRDPKNEEKEFEKIKFEMAIICSGERDAICAKALGYHPLWFNSETYQVSKAEIREIMKYVKKLYNIPDLDATGIRRGTDLALKYIDIHTVWLPDSLRQFRDRRGNPCKDFRDWCEHWKTKEDFRILLEVATPAKFWTESVTKEGVKRYSIDISCLHEFLGLNGFYTLKDDNNPEVQFVKITGHTVSMATSKDIRAFVYKWSIDTGQPRGLRNLILSTPTLGQTSLEALKEINPDFTNFTPYSQFFHFPRFAVEVRGDGMVQHDSRKGDSDRYVWEENVIDHDIKILPDMFEITNPDGEYDSGSFDIKIHDKTSKYFRYLINSSRIYWRKEQEENISGMKPEDRESYLNASRFCIDGEALTPEEIREQKQCLINKIFTIGYLMHRYKQESRAWAPFVMDNVIGDSDQCNGRSGKSLMFRALGHFTKMLKLSGRNPKFFDNQFCFEMVNRHQTFVVIDDCDKYLPFRQFYDNITSDITINAKNVKSYNLNYMEAPKFVFTTNYVPRDFDTSSVARMLFVVFSDYYHVKTDENDYLETRSVHDDFGKDLFSSAYTEKEWEADINFVMQCVRFYLSVARQPVKIQPRLENIIFRRHIQEMSEGFRDWAESFFSVDENGQGENLNKKLVKAEIFEAYKRHSGQFKVTMPKFTRNLKSFCFTCDYIDSYNPPELTGKDGRIIQKVTDDMGKTKTMEMVYIRTKRAVAMAQVNKELREEGFSDSNYPRNLFAQGEVYDPK